MAALGYLAVLDDAGHPRQRVAVHETPFSIGRGFASDLLLDDPHIAPLHATLCRDETGGWHLIDAGTLNRLRVAEQSLSQIALTDTTTVTLGRTTLRFHAAEDPVAPERALRGVSTSRPRWQLPYRLQGWPGVLLLAIALSLLEIGRAFLAAGAESLDWDVGRSALEMLGIAVGWGLGWGLLSRLFAGRTRFSLHLSIGLLALLTLMLAAGLVYLSAFAFDFAWGAAITSALACAVLGATVWLHLRAIAPTHRLVCTLGSLGLALALIGLDSGRQYNESGMLFAPIDRLEFLPPALRLSGAASLDEFLDEARALRQAVDASVR